MSASKNSPPPQTYSRLFRPWDGNTQQDNTITSTTNQTNISVDTTTVPFQSPSALIKLSDNKCDEQTTPQLETPKKHCSIEPIPKKIKMESPVPMTILSTEPSGTPDNSMPQNRMESPVLMTILPEMESPVPMINLPPTPNVQQHISMPPVEYLHQPFYPPNPYNGFLLAGSTPHVNPFIGIDPFIGSMEQEYARILAEEAQMKMMTARKQRPKKFKCPECNVAFSNNGQLKGHYRIHTGKHHTIYSPLIKITYIKKWEKLILKLQSN